MKVENLTHVTFTYKQLVYDRLFTDSLTILPIVSHGRTISRSETRECGGCYCRFVSLCIDCIVDEHPRQPLLLFNLPKKMLRVSLGCKKKNEKIKAQYGSKNVRIDG